MFGLSFLRFWSYLLRTAVITTIPIAAFGGIMQASFFSQWVFNPLDPTTWPPVKAIFGAVGGQEVVDTERGLRIHTEFFSSQFFGFVCW